MPRFAAVFSLLIMAGVGLPPFALFFCHIEMLLQPSLTISSGLWIILLIVVFGVVVFVQNDAATSFRAAPG